MRYHFLILLMTISFAMYSQTISAVRQKVILNSSCTSDTSIKEILPQDLKNTDVNLTTYLVKNYAPIFQKIEVFFCLKMQKNNLKCYQKIIISDSTQLEKVQIDNLAKLILECPELNKIKMDHSADANHVVIAVYGDKKGKLKAYVEPAIIAKALNRG